MHTRNILVATFVAGASLAAAEPERPKFYFPRQVKRELTNTTITSAAVQSTAGSHASTETESTKRDLDPFSLSDFFSSLLGDPRTQPTKTTSSDTSSPTESQVIVTVSTTDYVPSTTTTVSTGTSTDSNSTSTDKTSTSTDSGIGLTNILPTIILPTITLPTISLPDAASTTTSSASITDSATPTVTDSANSTTTDSSSAILIGPGGVVSTSSSTAGGLIPILSGVLSDLTSGIAATTNVTETATATATSSATETGLLPTLSNILTGILPTPTSTTSYPGTAPTSSTSDSFSLSDILTLLPTVTSSSTGTIPTSVTNGSDVTSTVSASGTISVPVSIPVSISTSDVVSINSTIPTGTSSVPIYSTSSASVTDVGANSTTATSSVVLSSVSVSDTAATPTPTVIVPQNTTTTPVTSPYLTTAITSAPASYTSVPATNTITGSESWLPTTIIVQQSSIALTTGDIPTTATGVPTYLPQAISPEATPAAQPDNTTPIQISFGYGLNYKWIVDRPLAAAQLFYLIPQAVAHDLGFSTDKVVMRSIVPYDTSAQLGFITSQAILYIPSGDVEQLRLDHKIPSSALYTNSDPLIFNMTNQINPAIDIIMGSLLDGSGTSTADGANPTSTSTDPNDAFGSSSTSSDQTSGQKGTTAAIALGVASLAGAYGAAMFIIARRYKRRKQRHQRTSSITSPSEMRQTGSPAMMGGALLSRDFVAGNYGGVSPNTRDSQGSGRSGMNNSGRTAFISAPVAAENSLGWN